MIKLTKIMQEQQNEHNKIYNSLLSKYQKLETEYDKIKQERDILVNRCKDLKDLLIKAESKNEKLVREKERVEKNLPVKEVTEEEITDEEFDLKHEIAEKDKEIEVLNYKLNNANVYRLAPEEKIMAVNFVTEDSKLCYCIPCKNTTIFSRIEEQLYEKYPEYRETDNYFMSHKNRMIKRYQTIEENKLESGESVVLYQNQD